MRELSGSFELTILSVVVALPVLVALGLALALPKPLRQLGRLNAYRMDGSLAPDRRIREFKELIRLIFELMWVPLLILMPLVFGACLFHQFVMPVDEGWTALELLVSDPAHAKKGIRAIAEKQLDRAEWQKASPENMREIQQFLWNGWPILLILAALVIWGCFGMLRRVNAAAILRYREGVAERRSEYVRLDYLEMVEREQDVS